MSENKSFFFNVLGVPPSPTQPAPDGSFGAPAHLNDYDEVWFNHASDFSPESVGHLWLFPRTIPHPGFKRPPRYPPNPVQKLNEIKKDVSVWWKAGAQPPQLLKDNEVQYAISWSGRVVGDPAFGPIRELLT